MTVSLTTPITGAAQTGFTTPTYTLVADVAPDNNGKQWAITALGGTQTGVTTHSVAAPFTVTFSRPKILKGLGPVNPVTGVIRQVPRNAYTLLTRKGALPLAGQAYATAIVRTTIEVPAGTDLADTANIRAMLSAHIGALTQVSSGVGDSAVTGVI